DSDDVNGESSSYLEEVKLLELLNKPDTVRGLPRCKSVLELYAHEVSPADGYLYIVMEMGDMDMAQMLTRRSKRREKVDLNFVRHHWGMMVECVREIHERLVIHADLKPANFLVTKGELKLIDFGIAKSANADTTKVDFSNQVGTLNYMSPEALGGTLGTFYKGAEVPGESAAAMRLNRKTDVWSLGCILYLMVYMRTPFQDLSTAAKMRKIPDPLTRVKYPQIRRGKCPLDADALVDMEWDAIPVSERNDYEPLGFVIPAMQNCLTHSPVDRFDVMELLNMPFLRPDKLAWRR
ncbi:kinase-like domain-containing protein, partial [Blastocladiella britannica]